MLSCICQVSRRPVKAHAIMHLVMESSYCAVSILDTHSSMYCWLNEASGLMLIQLLVLMLKFISGMSTINSLCSTIDKNWGQLTGS